MRNSNKYLINVLVIMFLMVLVYSPLFITGESFYTLKNVVSSWFPDELEQYKLKFVSVSFDGEQAVSSPIEMVFPVEIINMKQQHDIIVVETVEKSPVICPIDCVVKVETETKTIYIEKFNYVVELSGFEIVGVKQGDFVKSGQVIGTLQNRFLYVKVKNGNKVFTLDEIRGLFG